MAERTNNPVDLEEADLTPRKAFVLVGVGGTGAKFLTTVAEELAANGQKFGEALNGSGAIVEAILVDGDSNVWAPSDDNPDAQILLDSGVKCVFLYEEAQNLVVRKRGLVDVMTSGFPSEADPNGCNADPRVSGIRYLSLRDRVRRAGDDDLPSNPRVLLQEIARSFKSLEGDVVLGERIDLVFAGGCHGGTGPSMLPIAADATEIFRSILGRGAGRKAITTHGYLMTSESAELDGSMAGSGERDKRTRRMNTAATIMYLDRATAEGGVTLVDGKTRISQVPLQFAHLVGGESDTKAVSDHYDPIVMAARSVVAQIFGRAASATSNIELGIGQPVEVMDRLLPRWGRVGTAELLSDPSRALVLFQKQRATLEAATGLNRVDGEEVDRKIESMTLDQLMDRALRDGSLERYRPSIDAGSFGDAKVAPGNARRIVAEFQSEVPSFREALKKAARKLLSDEDSGGVYQVIEKAFDEFYEGRQVGTLVETMERACVALEQYVASLQDELTSQQTIFEGRVSTLDARTGDLAGIEPGLILWPGQKRKINQTVDSVVSASNKWLRTLAKIEVIQALIEGLRSGPNSVISSAYGLRQDARDTRDNCQQVLDEIEPAGTVKSPFDLERRVQAPDFSDLTTDADPGEYELDELRAIVEDVTLDPGDVNLVGLLENKYVQMELARRAQPTVREGFQGSFAHLQTVRQITVPTSDTDDFEVDSSGRITNAKQTLGLPKGYVAIATNENGPVIMTDRSYGFRSTEGDYERGLFKEMIELALKDPDAVKKHFYVRGDLENLLPVYAQQIATEELVLNGNKGQIEMRRIPGTEVELAVYVSPKELADRAQLEAQAVAATTLPGVPQPSDRK